jgi:hypothetical protein
VVLPLPDEQADAEAGAADDDASARRRSGSS